MQPLTLSTLPFYIVPDCLMLVTAVILYRRRWASGYAAFFAWLCVTLLRSCVDLPLALSYTKTLNPATYKIYFLTFWCFEAATSILILAIVYRVFERTFSQYRVLKRWTSVFYMLAVALCLALAIVITPSNIRTRGVFSIILPLWQAVLLMRAGLLGFLFLVVFGIGIGLRDYLFGIAAGFALDACIILLGTSSKTHVWWAARANLVAGLIASVIWFVYLFVPHSKAMVAIDLTSGSRDTAHWKQVLSEFLRK
jgi:hypothetical protein